MKHLFFAFILFSLSACGSQYKFDAVSPNIPTTPVSVNPDDTENPNEIILTFTNELNPATGRFEITTYPFYQEIALSFEEMETTWNSHAFHPKLTFDTNRGTLCRFDHQSTGYYSTHSCTYLLFNPGTTLTMTDIPQNQTVTVRFSIRK